MPSMNPHPLGSSTPESPEGPPHQPQPTADWDDRAHAAPLAPQSVEDEQHARVTLAARLLSAPIPTASRSIQNPPAAGTIWQTASLLRGNVDRSDAVTEAEQILESASSVLVVDWPSKDVPDTLARAGYTVVVKSGPEPDNYLVHELHDGEIVARNVGRPPGQVDVVYSHRPLAELPGIIAMARDTGAQAVWCQSGLASAATTDPKGCWVPDDASREARSLVESAGLRYVEDTYIADAVRRLGIRK